MSQPLSAAAFAAAQNYERNLVTYTMRPFTTILLEDAAPQPGERVVDVACGTGIAARQTAPRVGVTGTVGAVDLNPAILPVARPLPPPPGAAIDSPPRPPPPPPPPGPPPHFAPSPPAPA